MQYLDLIGLQQLWTSAKAKFAIKGTLANSGITDGYSSIETGTVVPVSKLKNGILADVITGSDNHKLKTTYVSVDGADGLATTNYVNTKVGAVKVPAYTLTKSTSTDYAAVYRLQKDGANVGEAINIPRIWLLRLVRLFGVITLMVCSLPQRIRRMLLRMLS